MQSYSLQTRMIQWFRTLYWGGGLLLLLLLAPSSQAQQSCQSAQFASKGYIFCVFEPERQEVQMFWRNPETALPFTNLTQLNSYLQKRNIPLLFAMNAGMFNDQLAPIGLYIENTVQIKKINTRDGYGNFHLKPNGVFYVTDTGFGVTDTDTYQKLSIQPKFATQSGPMLVIQGKIHPLFATNSASYKMRNGVGVRQTDGALIFAISTEPVSFYAFADFFRTYLQAENALYLDGSLSSLFTQNKITVGGWFDLGPLIGIIPKI